MEQVNTILRAQFPVIPDERTTTELVWEWIRDHPIGFEFTNADVVNGTMRPRNQTSASLTAMDKLGMIQAIAKKKFGLIVWRYIDDVDYVPRYKKRPATAGRIRNGVHCHHRHVGLPRIDDGKPSPEPEAWSVDAGWDSIVRERESETVKQTAAGTATIMQTPHVAKAVQVPPKPDTELNYQKSLQEGDPGWDLVGRGCLTPPYEVIWVQPEPGCEDKWCPPKPEQEPDYDALSDEWRTANPTKTDTIAVKATPEEFVYNWPTHCIHGLPIMAGCPKCLEGINSGYVKYDDLMAEIRSLKADLSALKTKPLSERLLELAIEIAATERAKDGRPLQPEGT